LLFSALVPVNQHQLVFLGTIYYWHILSGTLLMIYTIHTFNVFSCIPAL